MIPFVFLSKPESANLREIWNSVNFVNRRRQQLAYNPAASEKLLHFGLISRRVLVQFTVSIKSEEKPTQTARPKKNLVAEIPKVHFPQPK